MKKILLTILLAASVSANAATVNVNGTDYEVNTVTGTYSDLATILQGQKWWNDTNLAESFALAFGAGQGNPIFLHDNYGFSVSGSTYGGPGVFLSPDVEVLYATAELSQVPIPAAAFMFAPALLGFLGLRRRSKQA